MVFYSLFIFFHYSCLQFDSFTMVVRKTLPLNPNDNYYNHSTGANNVSPKIPTKLAQAPEDGRDVGTSLTTTCHISLWCRVSPMNKHSVFLTAARIKVANFLGLHQLFPYLYINSKEKEVKL